MTRVPTAFQKVFDRLCELVPHLETLPGKTVQAARLVQEWLDAGCDPDLDILPAINKAFANMKGRPNSPGYFDKAVTQAREARIGSAEHKKRQDASRAKTLGICKRAGIYIASYDEAWLQQYESENGQIA
jgi:hypothetical protein